MAESVQIMVEQEAKWVEHRPGIGITFKDFTE